MIVHLYNKDGIEPEREEDACAKHIKHGENNESYLILKTRSGELFDPRERSHVLGGKDKMTKDPQFKFRNVSKKAFAFYVNFLQRRKERLMLCAERESKNER